MHKRFHLVILSVGIPLSVSAQHEHQHHTPDSIKTTRASVSPVPMERTGSGTSWLPDVTPLHAHHLQLGDWTVMAHGNAFLRFTAQDLGKAGAYSANSFSAPNWFMSMGTYQFGNNREQQLMFRLMLSLERLTEGGDGYPLLFQTGESWNGTHLVDQQHPHDLFMELAMEYSRPIGSESHLSLYFGLPGEPALGPPAFMHRPSAKGIADAPLGHHWQDATHITFGVGTVGWQLNDIKLEGSIFTGREPDEHRLDFDRPRFDSYSSRLSWNPNTQTALQVSTGFLKSPEALEEDVDIHRTTASVVYVTFTGDNSHFSSAVVWGINKAIGEAMQHSILLESDYSVHDNAFFGRVEFVQKSAGELEVPFANDRLFLVSSFTLGGIAYLTHTRTLDIGAGIQTSIYGVDDELQSYYGKFPFSIEIFLRVLPSLHKM